MKKILSLSMLACICVVTIASAQNAPKASTTDKKTEENIIIRKKGKGEEKMTIVIDGNKVTLNGKPVADFKGKNIEIIKDGDLAELQMEMPIAPLAPEANGFTTMNDDFMREVRSNKAFLGVMTKKADKGAEITEVTNKSAAEAAGLKEGDIITKVGDENITDADDLYKTIGKLKPEDKVTIAYLRDGKPATTEATLGENKQVRVYSWRNGNGGNNDDAFNMQIAPEMMPRIRDFAGGQSFWNDDKPRFGFQVQDTEDGKGVTVLEVNEDEPAAKAGIEEDDIITSLNGKDITSVDDFKEKMKEVKKGDTVKVEISRDGKKQTLQVKFPKNLKTTDL